jgi:dTDP-4-dehydrorhamnose 3,5-epimerase
MGIHIESTHLNGIVVLRPDVHEDHRGFFFEVFRADHFELQNLPNQFLQENQSGSDRGVVRGLHFQWDPPMGKLMRVVAGSAFFAAVDIRKNSPTLGQWYGKVVSAEDRLQIWAPAGFARGFCVVSDHAEVQYKCTAVYNPSCESEILWNDSSIAIDWPVADAKLSEKDANAQTLHQWLERPESDSFRY